MTVTVSKSLYSREILLKTAFSFTDRVYLHLEQDGENWIVSWKPRAGQNVEPGEFENELIAQSLREKLLEQNADIRRIILARAFASTVMDNRPGETVSFSPEDTPGVQEDPAPLTEAKKADILKGWFDGQ